MSVMTDMPLAGIPQSIQLSIFAFKLGNCEDLTMSEFTDYLHEVFELAGPITIKRMFNGHTLYFDGLPVGIVYEDTLYLKADAETRNLHEQRSLPQFTYQKRDKTIGLPNFQAPDEIFEDRQEAAIWLKRAYEAGLKAKPKKKVKKSI